MGQSWKQQVEDLDPHRHDRPLVYRFSKATIVPPGSKAVREGRVTKNYPQGMFWEDKLHGAYDGNNS